MDTKNSKKYQTSLPSQQEPVLFIKNRRGRGRWLFSREELMLAQPGKPCPAASLSPVPTAPFEFSPFSQHLASSQSTRRCFQEHLHSLMREDKQSGYPAEEMPVNIKTPGKPFVEESADTPQD